MLCMRLTPTLVSARPDRVGEASQYYIVTELAADRPWAETKPTEKETRGRPCRRPYVLRTDFKVQNTSPTPTSRLEVAVRRLRAEEEIWWLFQPFRLRLAALSGYFSAFQTC